MAEVKLAGVGKAYGDVKILRGIDLEIRDGEFMVFVGPSGCGKSTLLRTIAGLEDITGGELRIGGRLVNDVPPAERGIAMVFQSYALYPHMNLYDNMAFGLKRWPSRGKFGPWARSPYTRPGPAPARKPWNTPSASRCRRWRASSCAPAASNRHQSMAVACSDQTARFTPPATACAPKGPRRPGAKVAAKGVVM